MGAGVDYFDALSLDETVEVPEETSLETRRRLLYALKCALNGGAMTLREAEGDEVVSVSPEFTTEFGYSLEEFQALDMEDFFVGDSYDVAMSHGEDNLAASYVARCKKSNDVEAWYVVQGLTFFMDNLYWRVLTYTDFSS